MDQHLQQDTGKSASSGTGTGVDGGLSARDGADDESLSAVMPLRERPTTTTTANAMMDGASIFSTELGRAVVAASASISAVSGVGQHGQTAASITSGSHTSLGSGTGLATGQMHTSGFLPLGGGGGGLKSASGASGSGSMAHVQHPFQAIPSRSDTPTPPPPQQPSHSSSNSHQQTVAGAAGKSRGSHGHAEAGDGGNYHENAGWSGTASGAASGDAASRGGSGDRQRSAAAAAAAGSVFALSAASEQAASPADGNQQQRRQQQHKGQPQTFHHQHHQHQHHPRGDSDTDEPDSVSRPSSAQHSHRSHAPHHGSNPRPSSVVPDLHPHAPQTPSRLAPDNPFADAVDAVSPLSPAHLPPGSADADAPAASAATAPPAGRPADPLSVPVQGHLGQAPRIVATSALPLANIDGLGLQQQPQSQQHIQTTAHPALTAAPSPMSHTPQHLQPASSLSEAPSSLDGTQHHSHQHDYELQPLRHNQPPHTQYHQESPLTPQPHHPLLGETGGSGSPAPAPSSSGVSGSGSGAALIATAAGRGLSSRGNGSSDSRPPDSPSTPRGGAAPSNVTSNINGNGNDNRIGGSSLESNATSRYIQRRQSLQRAATKVAISRPPYEVPFPAVVKKDARTNYIRTTKYTLLTFLPLNLAFQFRRFYNIYFLLGALSVISGYSSLSPLSQVSPLLIVLAFSAAKDAIEDYNRYRADSAANNVKVRVIRSGASIEILSMDIQPGDVLYVTKGEKFPVDAMILSSSYEDGTCFIETAELDGETNLKRRSATTDLARLTTIEQIATLTGVVQCEYPNENLLSFEGRVHVRSDLLPTKEKLIPLSMNNLFLRGAVLRNTEFAYALVIYTGKNTKIIKNLKQGGLKSSTLEARLNWLVVMAFVYNAFLLVTSVVFEYWHYNWALNKEYSRKLTNPADYAAEWYLGPRSTSTTIHALSTVISFFSLYTYVIPISLFVTLEMTRLAQAVNMAWDKGMTYERTENDGTVTRVPMRTNNSNLNEDLGCIEYIFSDKTGTLTQNSMRMAQWFCRNHVLNEMEQSGALLRAIRDNSIPQKDRDYMAMLLLALGLCHGVIPSIDERTGEMIYESQSPDETALLVAARQNGVKLLTRTKANMGVEILNVIEFTSTRKRMSVIIRTPEGIRLYCKGADNIIMARLSADPKLNDASIIAKANDSLVEFSNQGLRTLVIGYRTLSNEEYETFRVQYEEAEQTLENREGRLDEAAQLTIEYLLKAGIKLWLLTGDKQETAINIGMSSRLITTDMRLMILASTNPADCDREMDRYLAEMAEAPNRIYALVVNGDVLNHAINGPQKQKFLQIGTRCHSVICTRVTPLQKALVVRLVRSSLRSAVTLAIGDGANDVSMIQEAHVGVGIMGKEGTQAVRAADFAFGEFRFLERLLSVHGRFNYLRMCNLIFFSFYKNLAFITVQWWFGFFNAWSGQTVFEEIFFIAFNVMFTSFPPLAYAIYERDVHDEQIERYPQLYNEVRDGLYWNAYKISSWFTTAILHSVFIFGSAYLTNFEGAVDTAGRSTGYWVQCYLFSTPLLISVLFKMVVMTRHWVWPIWLSLIASMAFNIAIMFGLVILTEIIYTDYNTAAITHALPAYYLLCLLMPALCNVPDILGIYFRGMLRPSDADIVMEESKMQEKMRRGGVKDVGIYPA
ncbi:hypothetical protein BC831DRAFT_459873 [Entophlyctis helioformis]|nr:hypothetical protein BC831DRAFT_459873 [Entophlyctis helioformis]